MLSDKKNLLIKTERFCAYQERCSYEIKQKMSKLGADKITTEKIISSLKENDFLNDERFAKLFVSGKFRIKKWGKNKIRNELRKKKISDELINKGLNEINEREYIITLKELAKKKAREIQSSKFKVQKIVMYLISKGFESELIWKNITLQRQKTEC
ncbi:MAG: regulatory protein RecX [Bacteroidota bacterium]